jgi:peptidoglycan/xylan/chitin deacetylase (PgdA/CDA1 family)
MADIIAAHPEQRYTIHKDGGWWIGCEGCDWQEAIGSPSIETNSARRHHAHVAEELTKAGYGLLPDLAPEYGARTMLFNGLSEEPEPHGPNPNPSWFNKSTHVRLVGPWQELEPLADPLAAALADPEGRTRPSHPREEDKMMSTAASIEQQDAGKLATLMTVSVYVPGTRSQLQQNP